MATCHFRQIIVILGPFGEHKRGFPLALYSYGVPEAPKTFHSKTEVKKVPNRGEESAQIGQALLPVFSALTKNSNFVLDWRQKQGY
jgi:hypothetical protein